jgi:hypothetical protein
LTQPQLLIQSFEGASNRAIIRAIFATARKSFSPLETAAYSFGFAVTCLRQPRATVMQIDQDLYAALYVLGFNFLDGDLVSGEIAEIKGDMSIKLVHPPGEELKFVVELPGEKQMVFSVNQHQIVELAEPLKLTRN